ncbi:MAG: ABC transporter permease, partial [Actinobacteria bacterium]|nr:ABC transporter permease [Actinomycetota bacterium]
MNLLRLPAWASSLIGVAAVVVVWWIASVLTPSAGSYAPVPSPVAVLQTMFTDGFAFYWPNFSVTITEAAIGYFWGNLAALLMAAIVLLIPWLEGIVTQIAVLTYCVPIVAIGPLAIVILGGAKVAGAPSTTAIFFAALSVVFTTVVGSLLGLKAADKAALDVVSVYGGSRFTQLRKVRL